MHQKKDTLNLSYVNIDSKILVFSVTVDNMNIDFGPMQVKKVEFSELWKSNLAMLVKK